MPQHFAAPPARRITQASLALCLLFAGAPVTWATSFASSASDSASSAASSASDSLQGSSNSSGGTNQVAEGDYRVVEVLAMAGPRDTVQLRLAAPAGAQGDAELRLTLPRDVWANAGLTSDDAVRLRLRPYGYEFANARTTTPFFLVLHDTWQRELSNRPVTL